MAISTTIEYAPLEKFRLDAQNPRLGSKFAGLNVTSNQLLDEMEDWKLDELATSFLASGGFWVQEALLVIAEKEDKQEVLTVIEGNRRLAALIRLNAIINGNVPKLAKWRRVSDLASESPPSKELFDKIPYIRVDSRTDVDEYLGFRHVTGIEEWNPEEKAAYIAKLIDHRNMSYEEVMRKIGSKTNTVRQHYIAYRLLQQMKEEEVLPEDHAHNRFSVMYLSLRTPGVRQRLGIDLTAQPDTAFAPVPTNCKENLSHYARWIFGDDDHPPLFTDSREVDKFGRLLESDKAFKYLTEDKDANFDVAVRLAGDDLPDIIENVKKASEHVSLALSQAHQFSDNPKLTTAVEMFGKDAIQLVSLFSKLHPSFHKLIAEKWQKGD